MEYTYHVYIFGVSEEMKAHNKIWKG